jgi:hypothetical protein
MPTNTTAYSVGDVCRYSVVVTDTGGTTVDSTVRFIVNGPTIAPYTATTGSTLFLHPSSGNYSVDIHFTEPGDWAVRMESSGLILASTGERFAVRPKIAST